MLPVPAVDAEEHLKCSSDSHGAYHPVYSNCQSLAIRLVFLIAGTTGFVENEGLSKIIELTRCGYEMARHSSSPLYWKELRYFAKAWRGANVARFDSNALRVREDPLSSFRSMKSSAVFVQRLKFPIRKAVEIAKVDVRLSRFRNSFDLLHQPSGWMDSTYSQQNLIVSTLSALLYAGTNTKTLASIFSAYIIEERKGAVGSERVWERIRSSLLSAFHFKVFLMLRRILATFLEIIIH